MNALPGHEITEVHAVIAFRFATSELGSTWTEICAYGTAVRVERRGSSA